FDLDFNGTTLDPQRSVMSTSFIGGRGTGVMTVSNGGRAEFFNGLSIGAPIGVVETIDEGNGSGTVTVTGPGSFINVASSAATDLESGGAPIALAVGQLRDALTDTFDPTNPDDANLQSGVLVIEDNAVVTTTAGFGDMLDDANAAIGKRGEVTLAGGELQVGSNLDNDGQINGFGLLRARTMDTSIFSVIRGGNPNSENFEIADPLRLVLLDASDDVMDPALTNRGLIEGRVNFEVSGTIVNEGQIETSGEIFANQLFTEVESRVRQAPGTDSPLRLRLSGTNAAGEASGNNNFGALHNRGEIEGELDFVVQGGVVNGDNLLPQPGSGSSVSGVIRGSGRILAGTFINHSDAEIRVRAGESLSILSNDTGTTTLPAGDGFPVAAGTNVIYRSMNLGSISVTDGELEIGYLPQSGGPFTPPVLTAGLTADAANFFINARYAEIDPGDPTVPNSAGTITANGGTLGFSTGIINFGGVMAFVGGDNIVNGRVINASPTFGSGGNTSTIPGAIIVTGDGTTVTFEDDVINDGEILVGPFDNVANFLGNLTNNGTIAVAFDSFGFSTRGAVITVSGGVNINGGTIDIGFLNAPDTMDTDISIALLTAGDLAEDSLFTELILPDLAEGQFWDIVYDTANDEVRLEIVESNAFGADFTGDGIVSQDDVDVWIRNAGIVAGASTIQGDADLDGDVDLADYNVLMEQLFTGVPELVTGAVAFGQGIVPEPGTALLLCLAAATAGVTRRR
ncbi:MAG: PEP-CTERM sorting domain-containing protein, partial [Planctomycetota bacterium]